jgi:hypothetical protein
MGVLQLFLKPGKQFVEIPNHIPNSNFKLVQIDSHFNIENHGFYQGRLYFNFLPSNLTNNSLRYNRTIVCSFDPSKGYNRDNINMEVGVFKVPRSFEVIVDLDSGVQVVDESSTKAGQAFAFKKSENSIETIDYVVDPPASDRRVSLGVLADKIFDETIETTAGTIASGAGGKVKGPNPFLYSMIVTFTYDDAVLL